MSSSVMLSLSALVALVPAAIVRFRPGDGRDGVFWGVLAIAVIGPVLWALAQFRGAWHTGFAASLWVTIAVTMAIFFGLAVTTRQAWRLTPLLVPYMLLLGVLATIWHGEPERPLVGAVPPAWIEFHILFAVVTYGLITVAAVAGLAVFLQERALKNKRPTALTRRLPAVAEAESLQVSLLVASEVVLALGLMSGMAAQYFINRRLLPLDHKTLLSTAAFIVIGVLLFIHYRTGIRGRRVARFGLFAYLLLTLAYPGVKFVTDVLLS